MKAAVTDSWDRIGGHKVRVLILWANPRSANLGVQVISRGIETIVSGTWSDALVEFQDFVGLQGAVGFDKHTFFRDVLSCNGPIARRIADFDLVIDSGAGDSFSDIYGVGRQLILWNVSRRCRQRGVTRIMAPQTVGPFETAIGRALGKNMLRSSAIRTARDERSIRQMEALGFNDGILATDVVFALSKADSSNRHDVVLNVSGLLWRKNRHLDYERYRKLISSTIRDLLALGRRVTLMPHVLRNDTIDDDVAVLPEIIDATQGDRRNLLVAVPEGLQDARAIIASSNVVIGSRMHACLNALSQGVPCVPLAYSPKFSSLLGGLGWAYTLELPEEIPDSRIVMDQVLRVDSSLGRREARDVRAKGRVDLQRFSKALEEFSRSGVRDA